MSDKALLTMSAGPFHEACGAITIPTFAHYANQYEYDLHVVEPVGGLSSVQWSKPWHIREALRHHRAVVWVDIDAAIAPLAPDITRYLEDAHAFQALTLLGYDPEGLEEDVAGATHGGLVSTGVWAAQAHPFAMRFFDDLFAQHDLLTADREHNSHEADAVWRLLGIWHPQPLGAYALGTLLLKERWNSWPRDGEPHDNPHIFHATHPALRSHPEQRLELLRQFVARPHETGFLWRRLCLHIENINCTWHTGWCVAPVSMNYRCPECGSATIVERSGDE